MTNNIVDQVNALFQKESARIDAISMATLGIPTSCCGKVLKPLSAGRLYALQYIESAFVVPKTLTTDLELQNEILKALYVLTAEPIDLQFLMLCAEQRRLMEKYQREKDELSLRVALELQSRYQAMFDARLVSFGDELGMLNPHKAQETLQAYIDSSFHAYQLLASSAGEDDGVKKKQTGKACGATGQSSTPSFLYRLLSIFGRSR